MEKTAVRNKTFRFKHFTRNAYAAIKKNSLFATLNFIFTVVFINVFQRVFGPENSVIAIITTILMGICAGKDVTNSPVKHFLKQTAVFLWMTVAACFSNALGPWLAIPINLITILVITYAFTYEYTGHLYFPYVLSYLFLLYISPVSTARLPLRLLSVVICGAVMVIYALILYNRNIRRPALKALNSLIDEATACADRAAAHLAPECDLVKVRHLVRTLSADIQNRFESVKKLPVKAAALLDTGRGLENLIILFGDPSLNDGVAAELWAYISETLRFYRCVLNGKAKRSEQPSPPPASLDKVPALATSLGFIGNRLHLYLTSEKRTVKTSLPFKLRVRAALDYSPVRLVYAVRAALLLTLFIIPVQYFALPHGKWLLFTVASVSLPYAEDVLPKAGKRLGATIIGGAVSLLLFGLIADANARSAIMMLSGYIAFYFAGYLGNYACATVGALGGAVFMSGFGFKSVAITVGIRLCYIMAGILVAFLFNVIICPFRRKKASESIFRRYQATSYALVGLTSSGDLPPSIYYGLVIRNNLLEKKLVDNAAKGGYTDIGDVVAPYRRIIREAHHRGAVKILQGG